MASQIERLMTTDSPLHPQLAALARKLRAARPQSDPSPFNSKLHYNLYSAFRIITAHQRRHLWQAQNVWEAEGFPAA